MAVKSKQLKAEENKTISITELTQLRFKMLKPYEGKIEIVNTADMGRVCTISISDFKSDADARVYGQLLVLAPDLLWAYLSDPEKMQQVVRRFEKKLKIGKNQRRKPGKRRGAG